LYLLHVVDRHVPSKCPSQADGVKHTESTSFAGDDISTGREPTVLYLESHSFSRGFHLMTFILGPPSLLRRFEVVPSLSFLAILTVNPVRFHGHTDNNMDIVHKIYSYVF
jgi:hypothetical protein